MKDIDSACWLFLLSFNNQIANYIFSLATPEVFKRIRKKIWNEEKLLLNSKELVSLKEALKPLPAKTFQLPKFQFSPKNL